MRRMILSSLVLLPVMAHAQAPTLTAPQPSSSSVLVAELLPPAAPAAYAMSAAAPAVLSPANGASHAVIYDAVQAKTAKTFTQAAMGQAGVVQYDLLGSIPAVVSAPQVMRAVEMDLSNQDLAAEPTVTNVAIHATIDEKGVPRDLTVAHSAGSVVDKKALAAVSQYRFTPAMHGSRAVEAPVTISIKIQKP